MQLLNWLLQLRKIHVGGEGVEYLAYFPKNKTKQALTHHIKYLNLHEKDVILEKTGVSKKN